jgi:hypothetical protein
MATKQEIKAAILKAAGNPQSGIIADMADEFAEAVLGLEEKSSTPAKEVRVVEPKEIR